MTVAEAKFREVAVVARHSDASPPFFKEAEMALGTVRVNVAANVFLASGCGCLVGSKLSANGL